MIRQAQKSLVGYQTVNAPNPAFCLLANKLAMNWQRNADALRILKDRVPAQSIPVESVDARQAINAA